jgi:F-type H+-transporting ATPase subunit b
MESLGKLGLDPIHFAAQVVNFLIIAWVIYRFLLKPLLATMKARREKIALGLADADRARTALEDAGRERDRILQAASAEAFRLLQNARDEAERLRAAALERAGRDAERMIEEARGVMALERRDMEKAVQALSLRLSGRILEKVVADLFGEEERSRIIARGLERIGAIDIGAGETAPA